MIATKTFSHKQTLLSIINNNEFTPPSSATYDSLRDPHNIYFLYSINNIYQMIATPFYSVLFALLFSWMLTGTWSMRRRR